MTNILNPKPITVRKLLKRDLLQIPKYQRSYSWETEQVTEFLEDLENSVEGEQLWFLGIVYTHEFDPDKSNLLDGQQRLTTLFILIKELVLFHENLTEEDGSAEFKTLATEELRHLIIEAGRPRIKLDTATNSEFAAYLMADTATAARIGYNLHGDFAHSHKLLDDAIKQVRTRLVKFLASGPSLDYDKFASLVSFVLDKIELIEIELGSTAAFHSIFENINDRGLHLTDSDKFKNLYCSLTSDIDLFEKEWFDTSKTVFSVGKSFEDDVFDSYYRSVGVEYSKDTKGFYATIRTDLRGKSEQQKLHSVTNIFKSIKDMSKVLKAVEKYEMLSLFNGVPTDRLNKASKTTNVLVRATWSKFKQLGVLVYASYLNYSDRSDKDAFTSFLTNLLNSVRFYLAADLSGIQANEIRKNTVSIASHLAQGRSIVQSIEIEKLDYAANLTFDHLDPLSFADNKKTAILLLLIQSEKNPSLIEQYDPKHKWSIEHLLPREWLEHWPNAANANWGEVHGDYERTLVKTLSKEDLNSDSGCRIQEFLGNKFYYSLGDNIIAKNYNLEHKQTQIHEAVNPVLLPSFSGIPQIVDYDEFGVKEVLNRTQVLAPILISALRNRALP